MFLFLEDKILAGLATLRAFMCWICLVVVGGDLSTKVGARFAHASDSHDLRISRNHHQILRIQRRFPLCEKNLAGNQELRAHTDAVFHDKLIVFGGAEGAVGRGRLLTSGKQSCRIQESTALYLSNSIKFAVYVHRKAMCVCGGGSQEIQGRKVNQAQLKWEHELLANDCSF